MCLFFGMQSARIDWTLRTIWTIRVRFFCSSSRHRSVSLPFVTYASAAILNGVASYSELPWITDKADMYESAIRRIAYCNVGKMPGRTTTSTDHLRKICKEWKDILFQQIDLYDSEVIIVCGTDTLQALNADFGLDLSKPKRTVERGVSVVDIYKWRGKRLLWAHVPFRSGICVQYTCHWCGRKYKSLKDMTRTSCLKQPDGKGNHRPAGM